MSDTPGDDSPSDDSQDVSDDFVIRPNPDGIQTFKKNEEPDGYETKEQR